MALNGLSRRVIADGTRVEALTVSLNVRVIVLMLTSFGAKQRCTTITSTSNPYLSIRNLVPGLLPSVLSHTRRSLGTRLISVLEKVDQYLFLY